MTILPDICIIIKGVLLQLPEVRVGNASAFHMNLKKVKYI
jgi:hypothetical protein